MRVIRLEEYQQGHDDLLAARFPPDPELLGIVRQISGRQWVKTHGVWTFPATPDNVLDLMRRCPADVNIEMPRPLRDKLNDRHRAIREAASIREAGDADIDFDFLTTPYAHQRAGLAFLNRLGSGALFWEMGLGKTKTAIDYARFLAQREGRGDWRVLVICPNTVKWNWHAEIVKHTGWPMGEVLEGSLRQRAEKVRELGKRGMFTIVNCESLSLNPLADALVAAGWDMVIVDESTRFKTPSAVRTKKLLKMASRVPYRVILTGTPITGKPEDAWAQMEFVAPGTFGTWWSYLDRYLVRNPWTKAIEGVKPERREDLAQRVQARSYRVLKSQVLDLPPKVYEDRVVELEGVQEKAYIQMRDELRVAIEDTDIAAWNILTQLLRLTQITAGLIGEGDKYRWLDSSANAKLAALDELLDEDLAGKPVVVYGLYQKELEALARRYNDHGDGIIYGPTPERERRDLIDEFQRGHRRLLFVQSHTGGIGINLTAAQYAVYYTRGWSLEDYLQSQDRLHRIGQQGTVTIIHLVARNTVDEQIAQALRTKQNVADTLTGDAVRRLAATVLGATK